MSKQRSIPKCQICGWQEASWAVQNVYKDELSATALGGHYRGFPVVKCCDDCRNHFFVEGTPMRARVIFGIAAKQQIGVNDFILLGMELVSLKERHSLAELERMGKDEVDRLFKQYTATHGKKEAQP